MTEISITDIRRTMMCLPEVEMGASLKFPCGDVLGMWDPVESGKEDWEFVDCHGHHPHFLIQSGNREFAVQIDVMLACLKAAWEHSRTEQSQSELSLLPMPPAEWRAAILAHHRLKACGTDRYGGKRLHEYKARAAHDCPTKAINFDNFLADHLDRSPYEINLGGGRIPEYYAACPSCLNPIRMFHVVPLHGEEDAMPYGQHVYQQVDCFDINEAALAACPLH